MLVNESRDQTVLFLDSNMYIHAYTYLYLNRLYNYQHQNYMKKKYHMKLVFFFFGFVENCLKTPYI